MDLSIIIVNWNSTEYLQKCLKSIYENTAELEFEVIVVDNASFDRCGEMLAQKFPQVKFVQSNENLGFAGANNLGVLQSQGRTLLFLNPDTEILGDAIRCMHRVVACGREAGAVGAKLLNSDRSVQTSCIQRFPTILNQAIDSQALRTIFPRWRVWGTLPLLEKKAEPVGVEVISGACLMMNREVFDQIGRFTTAYFMYSEDVDLCFKSHQAGLRNYYVDNATVVHHGGGSTNSNGQSHFSAVVMRESISKFLALRRGAAYSLAYRATVILAAAVRCAALLMVLTISFGGHSGSRNAFSRWLAVFRWAVGAGRPESRKFANASLPKCANAR